MTASPAHPMPAVRDNRATSIRRTAWSTARPPVGASPASTASCRSDHNTNQTLVGGQPNIGLPADPGCSNTFVSPAGVVLDSCLEGTDPACTGANHVHTGVCNSPTEQTFSGVSPAGGFRMSETLDLNIVEGSDCAARSCFCAVGTCSGGPTPGARCGVNADCGGGSCSTANGSACTTDDSCVGSLSPGVCGVCPPDSCPLQNGEVQIAADVISGQTKSIIWNVNDSTLIMGTTGAGNGGNICGTAVGGPACPTTATGAAIDLTSAGGDCLGGPLDVPPTLSGATGTLAYPAIDTVPLIGDFALTLKLQCE